MTAAQTPPGGVPPARRTVLPRPRLAERLEFPPTARPRVVLVAAPAGFGKTTLLGQWLTGEERVAWLSLEPEDGDLRRFLSRLVAVVPRPAGDPDDGLAALLDSDRPVPVDAVVSGLTARLHEAAAPTVLAFDDYHVIDSGPVHDVLRALVEQLPASATVAIASRADPPLPLPRLRARGELLELRAADLRFTEDEAAGFLREVMALDLAPEHVAALETRTEGWAAGLQLAALSLRGRDDPDAFVAAFTGSHRFVLDYLVEEVLAEQPEDARDFLLATSLLRELSGPLCDAVTGRDDGARVLADLERENLFVVPLDDERQWYRYHHLFADALRARLRSARPEREAAVHTAAGDWYAEAGRLPEAITHALAAGDAEWAADLVELALPDARKRRENAAMVRWLTALPEEVARKRGVLAVGVAWTRLSQGDLAGAEAWLAVAEEAPPARTARDRPVPAALTAAVREREADRRTVPALIAIYRAAIAQAAGDVAGTAAHARAALAAAGPDDHFLRGAGGGFLGLAAWASGELPTAVDTFGRAVASLRAAGNVADELGATVVLAEMWLARGEPTRARRLYEEALGAAERRPGVARPVLGDLHVGLADVLREQDELDAAEAHLATARELGDAASLPENRYRWYAAAAGVRVARGDLDGAVTMLEEAAARYRAGFFPDLRPLPAAITRVRIAQGRLAEADAWARERGVTPTDPPSFASEFDQLTLARLLLARGTRESLRSAADLLGRVVDAAEAGGRVGSVVEGRLLRALVREASGDPAAAASDRAVARAAGEPVGYVRLFLDAGAPTGRREPGTAPPGSVALSDRELEVLKLLATDLTGPEVARRLFVSVNTLRTHTKHVFTKLDVTTRRAAVRRGTELGLL